MEVIWFSATSLLRRSTASNIPEDGVIHSYRRENIKSYIALTGSALAEM
jgi:hypothetical protein